MKNAKNELKQFVAGVVMLIVGLSFMAAEALTAGITAWALLKDRKKEAMA